MSDDNDNDDKWKQAREVLTRAEKDVDTALAAIRSAPRAEKTGVTQVVEEAFAKVRAARLLLEELDRTREPPGA